MANKFGMQGRLVRILGWTAVFAVLFSATFSAAAFAGAAPSEEETVYQVLSDCGRNKENEAVYKAVILNDISGIEPNFWGVYASTGKNIEVKTGKNTVNFHAHFGVMKSGDGISPCLCVFGRPGAYIDFAYYEIQIGDKVWTIDLTNAPLYSYCVQYNGIDHKVTYGYMSWVPLGSEGVQILKALKTSGCDFTCRVYVTGEEYYETTADADPQVGTDFGLVYDCIVKSGYLDAGGDVSDHTMALLKAMDGDASLPKVAEGTLAENVLMPVKAPQSITPENVLSQEYYDYVDGDVHSEISTYAHFRNTSKDKTLDGFTMIYYFTDSDNNVIEVDGRKMFTQTKSGLNAAPGKTFDSEHIKITDRAHIKYIHFVTIQNHFTDGTQVDIPRPSYFHIHCDVAAMPQKIVIEPDGKQIMDVGSTAQLSVIFKPAFADTALTWKSSDESVAAVDENGFVTAHAAGSVKISAEASNGKKATKQINVVNLVHALNIQGGDSLTSGESFTLTAIVTDPEKPDNSKVKWSTSDKSVAAVSSAGKVTAKKVLKTTAVIVTATAADGSGVTAQKSITIHPAPEKVDLISSDGVSLSNVMLEMDVGQTVRLNTAVYPADANQAVTWSVSKADIVSVSEDGALTANKPGKAVVTVKAENGKSTKIAIWVIAAD